MALAKGFPALALMSESDLSEDFGPFAVALEGALDPIVADFRRQMVSALGIVFGAWQICMLSRSVWNLVELFFQTDGKQATKRSRRGPRCLSPRQRVRASLNMLGFAHVSRGPIVKTSTLVRRINRVAT